MPSKGNITQVIFEISGAFDVVVGVDGILGSLH
jgi:hypothetical protein